MQLKKGKKQKVLSYWKHKFALTLKKYRGGEQWENQERI